MTLMKFLSLMFVMVTALSACGMQATPVSAPVKLVLKDQKIAGWPLGSVGVLEVFAQSPTGEAPVGIASSNITADGQFDVELPTPDRLAPNPINPECNTSELVISNTQYEVSRASFMARLNQERWISLLRPVEGFFNATDRYEFLYASAASSWKGKLVCNGQKFIFQNHDLKKGWNIIEHKFVVDSGDLLVSVVPAVPAGPSWHAR